MPASISYETMCAAYRGINKLGSDANWTSAAGWPISADQMSRAIGGIEKAIPPQYRIAYLEPLQKSMPQVADRLAAEYQAQLYLTGRDSIAQSYAMVRADSLVGAARDWSETTTLAGLQQFIAMVSDLFRSFVRKSHPILDQLRLDHKLPPLVTFATEPSFGPATLNADSVKEYCQADISIVSQPSGYACHPLLWGVLAHETGGHAVTHAIPGLADEITDTVGKLDLSSRLWPFWAEEAAADVYGVLNVGPSFPVSLGAWLKMARPDERMQNDVWLYRDRPTDDHPPDILRLYLLRGAVAALGAFFGQSSWLDAISAVIAAEIPNLPRDGGEPCIRLYRGDPRNPGSLTLSGMASDAELIGRTLVTAKFKALGNSAGNHAISEIEIWDDSDEKTAAQVAAAVADPRASLTIDGADDAHLLAGATMALCSEAGDVEALYANLTPRLASALQDSYKNDPVFNAWRLVS